MQLGGVGGTQQQLQQQQQQQPGQNNSTGSSMSTVNLISSQDWKSAASGQVVMLTEEERRTLVAEGYPIPQRFPLSKAEERSLKKIRRKIKNKISAQESRRKKKEYMEELEKKVQLMEVRILELEQENRLLRADGYSSQVPRGNQLSVCGETSSNATGLPIVKLEPKLASLKTEPSPACLSPPPLLEDKQQRDDKPEAADKQGPINQTSAGAGVILTNGSAAAKAAPMTSASQPPRRKISATTTEDDIFIDDILMSQERQENNQQLVSDEVDLVANLVGVVCENDNLPGEDISTVVKSICADHRLTTPATENNDDRSHNLASAE